jgi:hypothetical protein
MVMVGVFETEAVDGLSGVEPSHPAGAMNRSATTVGGVSCELRGDELSSWGAMNRSATTVGGVSCVGDAPVVMFGTEVLGGKWRRQRWPGVVKRPRAGETS